MSGICALFGCAPVFNSFHLAKSKCDEYKRGSTAEASKLSSRDTAPASSPKTWGDCCP